MRYTLPLLLVLLCGLPSARAANWSNWRGPEQNGVSRERDLPEKFSLDPKAPNNNLVWRAPHGSITNPIVQDGQVYIINRVGKGPTTQERVMAFSEKDGSVVWEHKFNVWHTGIVDDRVGWTHMAGDPETGNVYSHGTQGLFTCFSKAGKVLWQRSLTEEFGRVSGYGGRLPSPIVDGDLVILGLVNASWGEQTVGGTRFVAFDKRNGQVVWWASTGHRVKDTYYSSPVVANIGGQRLLISGGGDGGVHAFKVATGEKVWSYIFGDGAVNCSPVVQGNLVYVGHGEENENSTQGRVICLDASAVADGQPKLVWQVDGIKVKFASPVLHDSRLIVCDDLGNMYSLNTKDGERAWDYAYGNNTKGSPVYADGKIYVSEVDSKFHILKPGDKECEPLSSVHFRGQGGVPTELHGSPAVANGRVYFTTTNELVCIGKPGHKAKADPIPAEKAVPRPPAGAKAAWLQVVPADVSLNPGQTAEFKVRTFDSSGRLLGEVKTKWSAAPPRPPAFPVGMKAPPAKGKGKATPSLLGKFSAEEGASTRFTATKTPAGQFGRVVASLGGLTGEARVRVAPTTDYTMDFEGLDNGTVPGGWVNTQGKFTVATLPDGSRVLRKRNDTPSPLVARANAYITLPTASGYSVEADVMGTRVRNHLPEVGIGANRYVLVLVGNDNELRLVSWDAQKRISQIVPFTLRPGTWYRMKLAVETNGGAGVIRGKVWERGQPEPAAWTITAKDPVPNTEGSACLYGWSTGIVDAKTPGTEIYYDNVRVAAAR